MIEWIVDARDAAHPIPDQGQRPTCLAMATTGAHEHMLDASSNGGYLCAEYLHWASGSHRGGRGSASAAADALRVDGQPPADQWPYTEATNDGDPGYTPPTHVIGPFARRDSAAMLFDIDALVASLNEGRWPILGLRVTDALAAPGTGIVLPDGAGRAGHAVLVVGVARVVTNTLGPELPEGARLVCLRNSWGSGWGKDGHKLVTESAVAQTFITAFALEDDTKS